MSHDTHVINCHAILAPAQLVYKKRMTIGQRESFSNIEKNYIIVTSSLRSTSTGLFTKMFLKRAFLNDLTFQKKLRIKGIVSYVLVACFQARYII